MASVEVLRPYVEQKVADLLGVERVKKDKDGDIPIRQGSAVCFARLVDAPTGPMLRVFSPLVRGVQQSSDLLLRLNEINTSAPYVRFFWAEQMVYCGMDLMAETLQPEEIANALGTVGWHADRLDDLFKADFGGERMMEEEAPKPARADTTYL
jgi:hypothetical protein